MIDLTLMQECQDHGEANVIPYRWGAKPQASQRTDQITGSDCSGWTAYLFARCGIVIPAGSQEQMAWCADQHWPSSSDYPAILASSGAFICFALDTRAQGGHAGHVWITIQDALLGAWTIECHAGGGVVARPANTPVLRRLFHVGYRIPQPSAV